MLLMLLLCHLLQTVKARLLLTPKLLVVPRAAQLIVLRRSLY